MSIDLSSQIDAYVSNIDGDQGAVTVDDVAVLLDKVGEAVSPPVRSSGRRGMAVAAGAAVVTLLVIGAVAWLAPVGGESAPADEPAVTTTVAAVPAPETRPVTVTWTVDRHDERRGPLVRTIVSTSSGFLGTDRSRALWRSTDGVNWTPTLTELTGISVASSGSMTLVSGLRDRAPVLLRSLDGVGWTEIDRSEVPTQARDVAATTPSGVTWLRSSTGDRSSGVLAVVDADRATAVHEPPWKEKGCCRVTTLLQVGDNVVAYQFDQNEPQFSHVWEYLGNRQWSDTIDAPLSGEHAVVGDIMLRFDHTNAGCCGSPLPGESLWPLLSSDDGINWTEVGKIPGNNVHALRVNAGSWFWVYGPDIGGGGPNIEFVPGTTVWISTDGRNWQEIDIPAFPHTATGQVRVVGESIFISFMAHDEPTAQYWVGTVQTN